MTPRLRIIAGPNGSGKSTLARRLTEDYYVNLYKFINADVLNAEITKYFKTPCPFSMDTQVLIDFVINSTYLDAYKEPFKKCVISLKKRVGELYCLSDF